MGLFVRFIYQPFFNLLVWIYWALSNVAPQYLDMGNAVIIFTIIFRIIWIPISLSSSRSAKERHDIAEKFAEIQKLHAKEPIKEREETKKLMRGNRRIVIMSFIDIFFQLMVMLMLYRIFTTGLEGADFYLIYKWMPPHPDHFILTWLHGRFDLTHPNVTLNLINSLVIFIAEGLSGLLSPFPSTRNDLLTLFILPIGAFSFFAFMPAGKKLFVITTLIFSIVIMLAKAAKIIYYESRSRLKRLAYGLIIDKSKEGAK